VNDLFFYYNEEVLCKILCFFNARNFNVTIIDKSLENRGDLKWELEPWYRSNYLVENLPEEFLVSLEDMEPHAELRLPDPNTFIPSNFGLRRQTGQGEPIEFPQFLMNSSFLRAWFKQDTKFNVPKRNIQIIMNG
jgi:insulysin